MLWQEFYVRHATESVELEGAFAQRVMRMERLMRAKLALSAMAQDFTLLLGQKYLKTALAVTAQD